MAPLRAPFQGVGNILRFNWHFFALAAALVTVMVILTPLVPTPLVGLVFAAQAGVLLSTAVSLAASYYVYDRSPLYTLDWLQAVRVPAGATLLNIHAGFDETSRLLQARYPDATLRVFDFYDPARHTEVSIRRARRAYPPFPGTEAVSTAHLPLPQSSVDVVFALFAAHEIRSEAERTAFFAELARVLKPGGQLVVTEHLRDWPNFLAYNVGFLHFYARSVWQRVFVRAGLRVTREVRTVPLVTTFLLERCGPTA